MKIIRELVDFRRMLPLKVHVFEEVSLDYPMHHHREAFEITLTLGLSGTRMVGDHTDEFAHKDLVLIGPGLPHCWYDHGIVRRATGEKIIVVHFSGQLLSRPTEYPEIFGNVERALRRASQGVQLLSDFRDEAIDILLRIDPNDAFDAYVCLLRLLDLFGRSEQTETLCSVGYTMPGDERASNKIDLVFTYIQSNYTRKLKIEEVADRVHMSPSAFSHYFKKRALRSFTDYVTDLRLGKAARMLHLSETPVTQIAYECGFQNVSLFNRAFKKRYHNTPLRYRKHVQTR
ncbi:MAG: AraC family transcriptional regulator [Catalinimonas sp.]